MGYNMTPFNKEARATPARVADDSTTTRKEPQRDDSSCTGTQTTEQLSSTTSSSYSCSLADVDSRPAETADKQTPPLESYQESTERCSSSSGTSEGSCSEYKAEKGADDDKLTTSTTSNTTSVSGAGCIGSNEETKEAAASSGNSTDGDDSKEDSKHGSKRRVSFKNIEIREYPRCLGENPSVSAGPPISIGWRHNQSYVLDLDQYENYKDGTDFEGGDSCQQSSRRRRTSAEFQLPRNLREEILREECAHDDQYAQEADVACTEEEIQGRVREIQKARRQRQASYAMQEFETFEIFLESCWRKLHKLRCCSSRTGVSEADSRLYDYTLQHKFTPVKDTGHSGGSTGPSGHPID